MNINVHWSYLAVLVPVFGVYLYSESVLRQGAISNIDAKKFNIDTVVAELPGSVREAVSYRIHYGQMQDYIRTAKTPQTKATALSNLAEFTNQPEERLNLFTQVITQYPQLSESYRAYVFFLNNNQAKLQITIPQFHQYLLKFPQIDQYYIWTSGLAKIKQLQKSEADQLTYLLPLLTIKPEYRDYSGLYRQLSELAARQGRDEQYRAGTKLENFCLDLPMMETIIIKEMEKSTAAQKALINEKKNKAAK